MFIGVMLDNLRYDGIVSQKTGHEHLPFYVQAAQELGLTACFFRLQDMRPRAKTIKAFVHTDQGYQLKAVPRPQVIHNRTLSFTRGARQAIDALLAEGCQVYNPWNRHSKLFIHQILSGHGLDPFLPQTKRADPTSILEMLHRHPQIILKPVSGSLGSGVMKIETTPGGYVLHTLSRKEWTRSRFRRHLPLSLLRAIQEAPYLAQEFIALASYQGSPFDLRVSCQKNGRGQWQVTGIAGKVAPPGSFITNVAKGGKVYPLEILLPELDLTTRLHQTSLAICQTIEDHIPGMADLGLDMGITHEGGIKFIESNARDLRISLRMARLLREWRASHATPIAYGHYLLKKGNK